jgi:hypothetical protein
VSTGAITRTLQQEGFNFQAMPLGGKAADLTSRAERIAENAAKASTAATPPAPTAP